MTLLAIKTALWFLTGVAAMLLVATFAPAAAPGFGHLAEAVTIAASPAIPVWLTAHG